MSRPHTGTFSSPIAASLFDPPQSSVPGNFLPFGRERAEPSPTWQPYAAQHPPSSQSPTPKNRLEEYHFPSDAQSHSGVEEGIRNQERRYVLTTSPKDMHSIPFDINTQTVPAPPPPSNVFLPQESDLDFGVAASPTSDGRPNNSLDHIEDLQDDLRDARDDLVGQRWKLKGQRENLKTTRQKTVAEIGHAFDLMRRHFLSQNLDVPSHLEHIWTEVDTIRDVLGTQEIEYEEAEEKYNLKEWRYTEKERRFVDHLSGAEFLDLEPSSSFDDAEDLTQFAFGQSDDEIVYDDFDEIGFPSSRQQVLTNALLQNDESAQASAPIGSPTRLPNTAPSTSQVATPTQLTAYVGVLPEAHDMDRHRTSWIDIRRRIDEWLLEILQASSLQQLWLKELLPMRYRSHDQWLDTVKLNWDSDSPSSTVYHTGDTTVSGTTSSQMASSQPDIETDSSPETPETDVSPVFVTTLLPAEQKMDGLESVEIPNKIKSRDLFEGPRRVTFLTRSPSTLSISTQPSVMTRTSSGQDCSSISTIDEDCSCSSSVGGETVRQGSSSGKNKPKIVAPHVPAPGTAPSLALANSTTGPAGLHDEVSQMLIYDADQPTLSMDKTVTFEDRVDEDVVSNEGSQNTESPLHSDITTLPYNSTSIQRVSSRSNLRTRHPYPSFINVKSHQPWSFPILRLTPYPPFTGSTSCTAHDRLDNIPFVEVPNTPLRLPGPSKLPGILTSRTYDVR